ncbi:hypothetical protein VPH35_060203 [Triticum aestivum]|uniref:Uncharacterized protein n=3 Tax=Aegilops tauschii subsp. strangulata TaxID=200361 RepID=A0A453F609_AEGTS
MTRSTSTGHLRRGFTYVVKKQKMAPIMDGALARIAWLQRDPRDIAPLTWALSLNGLGTTVEEPHRDEAVRWLWSLAGGSQEEPEGGRHSRGFLARGASGRPTSRGGGDLAEEPEALARSRQRGRTRARPRAQAPATRGGAWIPVAAVVGRWRCGEVGRDGGCA